MATSDRNYQMFGNDWVDREVVPDVYPRKRDPYSAGGVLQAPAGTPSAGMDFTGNPLADIFNNAITTPGQRPVAYQRALSQTIAVTDSPIAIQPGTFDCDAIMISVPSSSLNSTFFGFGSSVSSSSGIEVVPGVPQIFRPENVREQWEIQRLLEYMAAVLGVFVGQSLFGQTIPPLGQFMSPRVVLNAHDYYLVNAPTISQNVATLLFNVPLFQ